MKRIFLYLLISSFTLTLSNCTDDEVLVDPTAGLIKLKEGYALGSATRIELWGRESFFAGYNKVTAVLYDSVSNQRITDAHIDYLPEMSMMGGMKHACPVEDPEEESINEGFPGAIEFIMPTSDMGSWKLAVSVHNHLNNKTGKANLDITVINPATSCLKSFVTEQSEKIFIGYYFPEKMKVGVNDFEVTAYKMVGPYEFAPVEDYTIVLTPEMPSMGHGSPNNVNPVYTAGGHYKGKVNFTMTGDWRLNLSISKNGAAVKDLYFDVTLE
jgi:YtkA-like